MLVLRARLSNPNALSNRAKSGSAAFSLATVRPESRTWPKTFFGAVFSSQASSVVLHRNGDKSSLGRKTGLYQSRNLSSGSGSKAVISRKPGSSLTLILAICTAIIAGCGSSNELGRVPVTGTVTLDDQPLDQGSISFKPVAEGTSSGATIENGVFAIPEEKGLPLGKYRVRIYSASDTKAAPADQPPGESGAISKERIPKSWNRDSDQTVDITGDPASELRFDIETSS